MHPYRVCRLDAGTRKEQSVGGSCRKPQFPRLHNQCSSGFDPSSTHVYAGGHGDGVTLHPIPSRIVPAISALPCTVTRYIPASPIRGSIVLTPSPASSSATRMRATPPFQWGMASTRSVSRTSIVSIYGPLFGGPNRAPFSRCSVEQPDSGPRSNNCSNSAFTCATCSSCTWALAQKVVLQLQHERDMGNLSPDGQATRPSASRDSEGPSGTHRTRWLDAAPPISSTRSGV